jgi:transmembrane sensor
MNAQIRQAACEWFVEFRADEPGEATRRSFLAWLRESPVHMAAYLEVAALWTESGAACAGKRWSVEELVSQARAESDNVVALPLAAAAPAAVMPPVSIGREAAAEAQSVPGRLATWSTRLSIAAAASIVLALTAAWWLSLQPDVYVTTVGEQRAVTLADGSIIRLNARSKLAVKFSDSRRAVELLEGQALFQVAKDVRRPFTVTSDGARVQAVGTEFDVRRKRSSIVVTVVEGRVAVFDMPGGVKSAASKVQAGPVYLSAGQQVTMSPAGPGSAKPVDPAMATAWTRRELVFEATPLIDVVEEFNLYNIRRLVIHDPALETFQMDGVFSSPDPAPLIRFLRSRPGVRVLETESEIVIESAASGQQPGETH